MPHFTGITDSRLNPGWFHPRRHLLRQLRAWLEQELSDCPTSIRELALDYGCGSQPYRPLLESIFQQYIGADLALNQRAEITIGEDGKLPLSDNSVDLVLSSQVLEHVASPAHYLAEAHRVLRAGGRLLLSTHGIWKYHPNPTDYWRWTPDGLIRQVSAAGFSPVHWRPLGNLGSAAVQLWQDATVGYLPKYPRLLYIFWLQNLMSLLDYLHNSYRRPAARSAPILLIRGGKS